MSNINIPIPISTNFLDTDIHTGYCASIASIEERRRALLMSIQALANIRQFAKYISSTIISATSTVIKVNPYIQNLIGDSATVTRHMHAIMETLQAGTQWDIEFSTVKVCIALAQALKQLPDEGNQNEIDATHAIANAYLSLPHPAPTRNNSPEPLPIRSQPPSSEHKNINNSIPKHPKANTPIDDIGEDAHRLIEFMKTVSPYLTPDEFLPPTNYTTFIHKGEENLSYWNDILTRVMKKNYQEGKYRGSSVGYAELGVPNAPHFLGVDYNNKFIIANTKKALFGAIA
ncbi:hypothetical protein AGABI2DRAFT_120681 [Agaricus bisporus var. bisporus H97]|uniref:hypothetical protein n=1 Tax=Agaricus bisporus var. bisporus (strain H97 / ATCC MYA-4626 / FGSC 10389) TaxID=936046 RepID=UPI00029F7F2F|nr:hypothetical protein AGABI2DRAFT_120681 [Agaricus bisporus var. bisporus H97]EKV44571.1 hypothetical protein AGABI2DRAFT_120681 [Agaricus bisporus var. bisporus H97]